jgi:hypothetical protein
MLCRTPVQGNILVCPHRELVRQVHALVIYNHCTERHRDQAPAHKALQAMFEALGHGLLRVLHVGGVQHLVSIFHRHVAFADQVRTSGSLSAPAACHCEMCKRPYVCQTLQDVAYHLVWKVLHELLSMATNSLHPSQTQASALRAPSSPRPSTRTLPQP